MKVQIVKGTEKDLDELVRLYDAVNEHLQGRFCLGWRKGQYPTRSVAENALKEGGLFIAKINRAIAGTMILNHQCVRGYQQVNWQCGAAPQEVLILHTLAIHPDYMRHHIGRKLLEHACSYGKKHGQKAIRLDVSEENLPAIRLYKQLGFAHMATLDLGYGFPLSWPFELYERVL